MLNKSKSEGENNSDAWINNALKNNPPDALDALYAQQDKQRKDEADLRRIEEQRNEFTTLPNFSQKIIEDGIPSPITNYLKRYEDSNQKDVFILSLITHLSGILPNYFVLHDGDELTTNLNVFITAPAGSGKSAMSHATKFFNGIDDELTSENDEDEIKNDSQEKVVKQKTLFIPANTSSAAIIKCLNNNGGRGIICETEADTLGNILTKDWANFDDILRKSFHNEPITMSRAGLTNIVKIPNPALSVILTGTPQQVIRLIPSTENGLFSRFLYYYFTSDDRWRDVFSSNNNNREINEMNNDLSELMSAIYFSRLEAPKIIFKWRKDQVIDLNEFFEELLYNSTNIYGSAINSVIYRLGLIASRLGAIIMFLNSFWNNIIISTEIQDIIEPSDNVFKLVKHMVTVLVEHSQYVFMQLPKSSEKHFSQNGNMESFFNMLPDKFSRKEAIDIFAPKAFIRTRTADGFLAQLIKSKKLEKNLQGNYIKPDKFR